MSAKEGFLSPEMKTTIERIRRDYADWFEVISATNRLAMEILPALKPDRADSQKVLEAAFYGRALQSIQAAVVLTERGMIGDARTVLRACVETALLQRKIADDAAFADRLVERHDFHRRKLGNGVLNNPQFVAGLQPVDLEEINATVKEIDSRYPDRKPRDINLFDIARSVDGRHLYELFFRPMSGDSAHGTLDSLARHVTTDQHGSMKGLAFGPQPREVAEAVSVATAVLFHVLDTAVDSFGLAQFRSPLADCLNAWKALALPREAASSF